MSTRATQIKNELKVFCPDMNSFYTNQEIIDILKNLQNALAKGVFEKTHAENLRSRDILIHFDALAAEYDLKETSTYIRFSNNLNELGYTIGSFINGMKGEKAARQALRRLSYMDNIEILYNVQLESDDCFAEYDAIVITPYGIFVVEVKNWNSASINSSGILINEKSGITYDLLGRMNIKEALLREFLGEKFPHNYHNILMFPNAEAEINDELKLFTVVKGSGVSYAIESYRQTEHFLSKEDIFAIKTKILSVHKDQLTEMPVNCDEIVDDYANLMALIEEASSNTENSSKNLCSEEKFITEEIQINKKISIIAGLSAITLYTIGLLISNHHKK